MLKRDQEIVFEAINQNKESFEFASEELLCDKEFLLKLIKLGCRDVFRYVLTEIIEDREFVLRAIKLNGPSVSGSCFTSDREIMLEAVKSNGYALYYASEELQQDAELVMEALKCNGFVLEYSEELLQQTMEQCYFGDYLGIP
nr:unnamed protein product [Naegleria fowleri]